LGAKRPVPIASRARFGRSRRLNRTAARQETHVCQVRGLPIGYGLVGKGLFGALLT